MKFVYFVIAALIAITFSALSFSAFGAMKYKDAGVTVRLSEAPCSEDSLAVGLSDYGIAKAATVTIQDLLVVGCWVAQGDKILLADMYGNAGYLMADQFQSVD